MNQSLQHRMNQARMRLNRIARQRRYYVPVIPAGLTQCGFEDEHCDCREAGVVHDVKGEDDFSYCLRHFAMIEKGRDA